jgi:hypothetical protein
MAKQTSPRISSAAARLLAKLREYRYAWREAVVTLEWPRGTAWLCKPSELVELLTHEHEAELILHALCSSASFDGSAQSAALTWIRRDEKLRTAAVRAVVHDKRVAKVRSPRVVGKRKGRALR